MGQTAINRSAAVVIAVTLQRLVDNTRREWSVEEEMVLDALRRSSGALGDASVEALSDYVRNMRVDQLRGTVSNVKGIYHEMLFAAAENSDGDAISAHMADAVNQPGWDVEFIVDGGSIGTVQLKAVSSPAEVLQHLARYPDIDVLATEEVAALLPGVSGSGFHEADLAAEVRSTLARLSDEGTPQGMLDAAEASIFVHAAFAARTALRAGRVEPRALRMAMGELGVGVTTALAIDVLLGGV